MLIQTNEMLKKKHKEVLPIYLRPVRPNQLLTNQKPVIVIELPLSCHLFGEWS